MNPADRLHRLIDAAWNRVPWLMGGGIAVLTILVIVGAGHLMGWMIKHERMAARAAAAITYTVACNDWDFYRQRAQVFHRATRARTDSGGTSFVTEAGTPIRLSPAVPCLIVRE